jgi:hypothetical protein
MSSSVMYIMTNEVGILIEIIAKQKIINDGTLE